MGASLRWPVLRLDDSASLAALAAVPPGPFSQDSARWCCFQPIAAAAEGVGDCPGLEIRSSCKRWHVSALAAGPKAGRSKACSK